MTDWTFETLFNFTGKVALVTGGASGIGLAIARAMTERGAQLVLFERIRPCVSWRSILVVKGSISAWWLT